MTVTHSGFAFDWLGYATLRIETPAGTVAYLDPGRYGVLNGEWTPESDTTTETDIAHPPGREYTARDGDLVCVTHDHHYDSAGIERVAHPEATVVVYEEVDAASIDRDVDPVSDLPYEIQRIGENDRLTLAHGSVRSLPAYNDPDGPHTRPDGTPFHPRGSGCGYQLLLEGLSLLWPGDSDALDAHQRLATDASLSVFVPPIGRSYTMDRHEAAELAVELDPDLVLPIHYNTFDALKADSDAFVADVAREGIPVALDESG